MAYTPLCSSYTVLRRGVCRLLLLYFNLVLPLQVCAAGVLKLGDLGLGRKMGPQTVDVASKVSNRLASRCMLLWPLICCACTYVPLQCMLHMVCTVCAGNMLYNSWFVLCQDSACASSCCCAGWHPLLLQVRPIAPGVLECSCAIFEQKQRQVSPSLWAST
jgi:hypothetical protein